MRICLMTETYRPEVGGGETQAEMLASGLVARGKQVDIVTRRSRPELAGRETVGRVCVHRLAPSGPGRDRKWGLMLTAPLELLRIVDSYDVVFVSGYRILGLPAIVVAGLARKPCVLKADSLGEMSGEFFRSGLERVRLDPASPSLSRIIGLRNRCLRRADRFVAISSVIHRELVDAGVDTRSIVSIPNGVDTGRFAPAGAGEKAELRRKLGIPQDALVATFTGRIVSYKGLPSLLRVWRDLCPAHPGAMLLLVGEGGLDMHACEDEMKRFVAESDLGEQVRFTGAVSNVEDYLKIADLFVFPTEDEAFGLSLVEAMACGLPSVSTRIGGLVDIVDPDVDGLVIEAGDEVQLGRALDRLLCDAALRERLGGAATANVRARFGADAVTQRYLELFEELAAR